jgi:Xaa-Pro aminopeptidase
MKPENLLIVADSERDANMLYAVRLFVPDAFIFFRLRGKKHLILSDLEIDRARKRAKDCAVHSLGLLQQKVASESKNGTTTAAVVRSFLKTQGLKKVLVPANFPHGLARELRRLKVKVKVKKGAFFPEREIKSADETKKISAALMMAEVGLAEGIQALRRAKIAKNGQLIYHNLPLTAEKLRAIINIAIIQAGGVANHTIVACGRQGCDPHEQGSGFLTAHQPIIIDIFPRSQRTGYFGDITRTVVRGQASEMIRKMYHTVGSAQDLAFSKLRHGTPAKEVHVAVQKFFEKQGYKTGKVGGRMRGFFHGTGHGLGLEVHEAPRVSQSSPDTLQAGHVVTVEPGLYYYPTGGVRLEDVGLVTEGVPRNLTKFEKVLEV